jgi:hypothetical protein
MIPRKMTHEEKHAIAMRNIAAVGANLDMFARMIDATTGQCRIKHNGEPQPNVRKEKMQIGG